MTEVIKHQEAKRDVGGVGKLLRVGENLTFEDTNYRKIQGVLARELRGILSSSLVNNLGLAKLQWHKVSASDGKNPHSDLYAGFPQHRTAPYEISSALGVVQIVRAENEGDPYRNDVTLGVRVSGVAPDSNGYVRTVGVEYRNDGKRCKLSRFDVSIVNESKGPIHVEIPTKFNYSNYTAAIITPAMVAATSYHQSIVVQAAILSGGSTLGFFDGQRSNSLGRGGFQVISGKDTVQIGQSNWWSLSIPAHLQKVT